MNLIGIKQRIKNFTELRDEGERVLFFCKLVFALDPLMQNFTYERNRVSFVNGSEINKDSLNKLPRCIGVILGHYFYSKEISSSRSFFSQEELDDVFDQFFGEECVFIRELINLLYVKRNDIPEEELVKKVAGKVNGRYPNLAGVKISVLDLADKESLSSFCLEKEVKTEDVTKHLRNKEVAISYSGNLIYPIVEEIEVRKKVLI